MKRKFCFLVEFPFGGGPKKTITNFIYDYRDTLNKRPIGASLVHYNANRDLVKKIHFKNVKDSESFSTDYLGVTDLIRVSARKIEKQTLKVVEAKFITVHGGQEVSVVVGNYKLLYDKLGEIIKGWTLELVQQPCEKNDKKTGVKRKEGENADF